MHGDIPYRDFFLTTTPGTYYLQSFVFQLFGVHIILGRLLYFLFAVSLLALFNYILIKTSVFHKTIGLLLISIAFVGVGAYAFYNLEGLVIFLMALLLFKNSKKKNIGIFFTGIALGLLFIFKQSYAVYGILGFLCLILIDISRDKTKKLLSIFFGLAAILLPFFGYFLLNKALYQFIYFTGVFSEEVKGHREPFILTSLLFIPLFLIVLQILKKMPKRKALTMFLVFVAGFFLVYIGISPARLGRISTYIKDPLIYYYGFLLLFPLVLISYFFRSKNNHIMLYSVSLLTIFFGGASSGRDFTTVLICFPLVLLLCLELIKSFKKKKLLYLLIILYSTFPLFFFCTSLGNLFQPSTYTRSAIPQFEGILIPQKTELELEVLANYIKSEVKPNADILCFPYCPLVNVLTQRNSGSYFSFFYNETIRASDQARVIDDLKTTHTKLIVLQKTGVIEKEAAYEDKRLSVLKKYLFENYQLTFFTQNFAVYEK